jgi:WW domain-containing oxidoreductase
MGLGIASHILQHNPKRLLFLSHKKEHADDTIEHLKQYGDISKVEWVHCDLLDLKQVQAVGQKLAEKESDLDVLIFNAGIGVGKYEVSKDGYDTHFQTNVLSQFLLMKILLPNLKKKATTTNDARIVFQSSSMHDTAVSDIKFDSIEEINTDIGATKLYSRTKLADILVAFKLDRDLKSAGINNIYTNAVHPGLVGTDQQEQAVDAYGKWLGIVNTVLRPIMKDPVDEGYVFATSYCSS